MCRMMLFLSSEEMFIPRNYIDEFKEVAKQGLSSKCGIDPHGDGFGVAWISLNGYGIYKSLKSIWNAEPPIQKSIAYLLHARKQSTGSVSFENTHPFERKGVILAHNGTIYAFNRHPVFYKPFGETDSEKFLCILTEFYDTKQSILDALIETLNTVVAATSLNMFILTIPENKALVVNMFFKQIPNCPNFYTLWMKEEKNYVIIASEPLDKDAWKPLARSPSEKVIVEFKLNDPLNYRIYR